MAERAPRRKACRTPPTGVHGGRVRRARAQGASQPFAIAQRLCQPVSDLRLLSVALNEINTWNRACPAAQNRTKVHRRGRASVRPPGAPMALGAAPGRPHSTPLQPSPQTKLSSILEMSAAAAGTQQAAVNHRGQTLGQRTDS